MLELADKDIKTVIKTVFCKKVQWKLGWKFGRYNKIKIKPLEMKSTMYEMKNTIGRVNGRSDIAKENTTKKTYKKTITKRKIFLKKTPQ